MAGLKIKDSEFWKGLGKWDVVVLMETWVKEREWNKIENRLPYSHEWNVQGAKREHKKGRAKGGMVLGIRKEITMKEETVVYREEGIISRKFKWGEKKVRVVGVYINGDMEKKLETIKDWMEEKDERIKTIIGGDFNAQNRSGGGGEIRMDGRRRRM